MTDFHEPLLKNNRWTSDKSMLSEEFKRYLTIGVDTKTYIEELEISRINKIARILGFLDELYEILEAIKSKEFLYKEKDKQLIIDYIKNIIDIPIVSKDIKDYSIKKLLNQLFFEKNTTIENRKIYYEKVTNSLLSFDYTPPGRVEIYNHLVILCVCYVDTINSPPSIVDLRLDQSFSSLLTAAGVFYSILGNYLETLETTLTRTIASTQKIRLMADKKRTHVLQIYHHYNKIKTGMKLNSVLKLIKNGFLEIQEKGIELAGQKIPDNIKPPSADQIRRYLQDAGIIERDFKIEGRYKILQR